MGGKARSHPHLYDRMILAGATPDFPRPEGPPRSGSAGTGVGVLAGAALSLAIVVLVSFGPELVLRRLPGEGPADTWAAWVDIVTRGPSAPRVAEVAEQFARSGHIDIAATLYRKGLRLGGASAPLALRAAELSVMLGDCRRASVAWRRYGILDARESKRQAAASDRDAPENAPCCEERVVRIRGLVEGCGRAAEAAVAH
jgi:hypothetical protein